MSLLPGPYIEEETGKVYWDGGDDGWAELHWKSFDYVLADEEVSESMKYYYKIGEATGGGSSDGGSYLYVIENCESFTYDYEIEIPTE